MKPTIDLRFHRLRFEFKAKGSIHFPRFKSTNILRGAFGSIFRRIACLPECREPSVCPLNGECPYEQVFAPIARAKGPSGFRDLPRPLVFRGSHLDGLTIRHGEGFWFDVHLFRLHPETVAFLTLAFAQFATEGVGPGRGLATLTGATTIGLDGVEGYRFFADGVFRQSEFPDALVLSLGESSEASSTNDKAPTDSVAGRLLLQFLTPTELKHEGRIVETPDAPVLIARAFDRISTLAMIYGSEHAEQDTTQQIRRELLEAAGRLRLARIELSMVEAGRVSSRTGQKHGLEGFVGEVEYEGPADALVAAAPWLQAAAFTGVGRQTVWGKGEIFTDTHTLE